MAQDAETGAIQPRKNTVLVVDDEEVIRTLLQERINFGDQATAEIAGNGEQALEILGQREFDVILSDIKMPGMNGIDLLKRVKTRWPQIAVIIMSGYAEMSDTIEALRHGAVDFLEKPFEMNKVIEALDRVFRMKNLEYSRKEATRFLERETRIFSLPNDLDVCPIIANELTQSLADKGEIDISAQESIRVALNEMLFNAVEHGNLAVTFEEKTRLIESSEDYHAVIRQRAIEPRFAARRVRLEYELNENEARFVITDEGDGFDHSNLPDPTDPENLLSTHGRGILMTRIYMDDVSYNDKGNQVTLVRRRSDNQ